MFVLASIKEILMESVLTVCFTKHLNFNELVLKMFLMCLSRFTCPVLALESEQVMKKLNLTSEL